MALGDAGRVLEYLSLGGVVEKGGGGAPPPREPFGFAFQTLDALLDVREELGQGVGDVFTDITARHDLVMCCVENSSFCVQHCYEGAVV